MRNCRLRGMLDSSMLAHCQHRLKKHIYTTSFSDVASNSRCVQLQSQALVFPLKNNRNGRLFNHFLETYQTRKCASHTQ